MHSDKSIRAIDLGFDLRTENMPFRLIVEKYAEIEYDGPDGKPAVAKGNLDQITRELDRNGYGPIIVSRNSDNRKIWFADGKYQVELRSMGTGREAEAWQSCKTLEEALRVSEGVSCEKPS